MENFTLNRRQSRKRSIPFFQSSMDSDIEISWARYSQSIRRWPYVHRPFDDLTSIPIVSSTGGGKPVNLNCTKNRLYQNTLISFVGPYIYAFGKYKPSGSAIKGALHQMGKSILADVHIRKPKRKLLAIFQAYGPVGF